MFILKTAFWLTILILLLPSNEEHQRTVYGTAEAAVQDVRTFCVRNPGVCESSRQAFDTFSQKAQFGAQMVMNFISDRGEDRDGYMQATGAGAQARTDSADDLRRASRNTLTADDLRPSWRAPGGASGI